MCKSDINITLGVIVGYPRIYEATALLHSVSCMNIIGGDTTCMMPTKDSPNQITALTATSIMFEMISMIAENSALRLKSEAFKDE